MNKKFYVLPLSVMCVSFLASCNGNKTTYYNASILNGEQKANEKITLSNTKSEAKKKFNTVLQLTDAAKASGYKLPNDLSSVRVNNALIEKGKYAYNPIDGGLTIDAEYVTGDIVVTAVAIKDTKSVEISLTDNSANCQLELYGISPQTYSQYIFYISGDYESTFTYNSKEKGQPVQVKYNSFNELPESIKIYSGDDTNPLTVENGEIVYYTYYEEDTSMKAFSDNYIDSELKNIVSSLESKTTLGINKEIKSHPYAYVAITEKGAERITGDIKVECIGKHHNFDGIFQIEGDSLKDTGKGASDQSLFNRDSWDVINSTLDVKNDLSNARFNEIYNTLNNEEVITNYDIYKGIYKENATTKAKELVYKYNPVGFADKDTRVGKGGVNRGSLIMAVTPATGNFESSWDSVSKNNKDYKNSSVYKAMNDLTNKDSVASIIKGSMTEDEFNTFFNNNQTYFGYDKYNETSKKHEFSYDIDLCRLAYVKDDTKGITSFLDEKGNGTWLINVDQSGTTNAMVWDASGTHTSASVSDKKGFVPFITLGYIEPINITFKHGDNNSFYFFVEDDENNTSLKGVSVEIKSSSTVNFDQIEFSADKGDTFGEVNHITKSALNNSAYKNLIYDTLVNYFVTEKKLKEDAAKTKANEAIEKAGEDYLFVAPNSTKLTKDELAKLTPNTYTTSWYDADDSKMMPESKYGFYSNQVFTPKLKKNPEPESSFKLVLSVVPSDWGFMEETPDTFNTGHGTEAEDIICGFNKTGIPQYTMTLNVPESLLNYTIGDLYTYLNDNGYLYVDSDYASTKRFLGISTEFTVDDASFSEGHDFKTYYSEYNDEALYPVYQIDLFSSTGITKKYLPIEKECGLKDIKISKLKEISDKVDDATFYNNKPAEKLNTLYFIYNDSYDVENIKLDNSGLITEVITDFDGAVGIEEGFVNNAYINCPFDEGPLDGLSFKVGCNFKKDLKLTDYKGAKLSYTYKDEETGKDSEFIVSQLEVGEFKEVHDDKKQGKPLVRYDLDFTNIDFRVIIDELSYEIKGDFDSLKNGLTLSLYK